MILHTVVSGRKVLSESSFMLVGSLLTKNQANIKNDLPKALINAKPSVVVAVVGG